MVRAEPAATNLQDLQSNDASHAEHVAKPAVDFFVTQSSAQNLQSTSQSLMNDSHTTQKVIINLQSTTQTLARNVVRSPRARRSKIQQTVQVTQSTSQITATTTQTNKNTSQPGAEHGAEPEAWLPWRRPAEHHADPA